MATKTTERLEPRTTSPSWFEKNKKTLVLLTMVAPVAIWLLLLRYLPMGGIVLAFKNYKVNPRNPSFISNLINSKWVGFKNFEFLFKTDSAWVMIRNTLAYNIVFIILGVIIPVAFAIMMNEITRKFFKKAYQTMMFFPYFLSWVVVSYFLNALLDAQYGMIPAMQEAAGHARTSWYTTPGPWPFILTFANLWKNVGYSTVLYLAAITGIDTNQYEAAAIDGCGPVKILYKIICPMLSPSLVACALFQFMWSCNDFMGPLLYVQTPAKYPMSLFVKLSMDGDTGFAWNRILALSLISILPQLIVFFCAQDQFVEGISAGAVKG